MAVAVDSPDNRCLPVGGRLLYVRRRPTFVMCAYPPEAGDVISLEMETQGRLPECAVTYQAAVRLHAIHRLNVLEVGANIGACALSFAAAGAEVYAFEALPSNHRLLEQSIRLNPFRDHVTLVKAAPAVQAREDGAVFFDSQHHGHAFLLDARLSSMDSLPPHRKWERANSTLVRIDQTINDHLHLLRLGWVGHELDALQSSSGLLEAGKVDLIAFELDPTALQIRGIKPWVLLNFLARFGYTVRDPHGSELRPQQFHMAIRGAHLAFHRRFIAWADGSPLYSQEIPAQTLRKPSLGTVPDVR